MSSNRVVLLLGSNLGDQKKNLEEAIHLLERNGCKITKKSKIVTSEPVEFVSSNNFCNIATLISTCKSPISLLNLIKEIEKEMGRLQDSRSTGKYEDRIIDIDIVVFNNISFHSKSLAIPHHKHLHERDFSKDLIDDLQGFRS